MTKTLDAAVEKVKRLPESDHESIGRQVLNHVEKLRLLRGNIDQGRSLDTDVSIWPKYKARCPNETVQVGCSE